PIGPLRSDFISGRPSSVSRYSGKGRLRAFRLAGLGRRRGGAAADRFRRAIGSSREPHWKRTAHFSARPKSAHSNFKPASGKRRGRSLTYLADWRRRGGSEIAGQVFGLAASCGRAQSNPRRRRRRAYLNPATGRWLFSWAPRTHSPRAPWRESPSLP